ncbi:hypothetical protein [Rodentibacter genomosp. 2]|uniref:hypothetical protein n=1 Tax=Rodentibacter genomosp. 2 TaxID=1908266 RepID=UPI0021180853|nr:hypothetical protein [Rodentibacter genomosp. 2]
MTERYRYNEMGRLVQQQAGFAHHQNGAQIDRTYGYDGLGNLTQTRTAFLPKPFEAPQQTQYQYDNMGRRVKGILNLKSKVFILTRHITWSTARRKRFTTTGWLIIKVFVLPMTVWGI